MNILNYIKSKRRHKPKPQLSNWAHPWAFVATFGWAGRGPFVPGIWGSIAALPVGWLIAHYYSLTGLGIAIVVGTLLGTLASNWVERTSKSHDASLIVVDEAVGIWITILGLPTFGPYWVEAYGLALFYFLFFDIIKPWPINWIDKKVSGGFGVMADDIAAGIIALICTHLTIMYLL